ncbi:unnamed protein product, partial [marine sediment metagenome]
PITTTGVTNNKTSPQYGKNVLDIERMSRRGLRPIAESNIITANSPIGKRKTA